MSNHPPFAHDFQPVIDLAPWLPDQVEANSGHPIEAGLAPFHEHDPDCTGPACCAGLAQALALDALGDYLEEEGPRLERMMRLPDGPGALADLAALQNLHTDIGEEAEGLAAAAELLERLLDDLAETPMRDALPMLILAAHLHLARQFDGAVCWVGAHTEPDGEGSGGLWPELSPKRRGASCRDLDPMLLGNQS
jgi:hypothetical protein